MYIVQDTGFGKIIMDVNETQTAQYVMYSVVVPILLATALIVGVIAWEIIKERIRKKRK